MPGGRPPYEITPEIIAEVEKLASQGLNLRQISTCLGIHYDTLNEKRKAFSEFNDAIGRGRVAGIKKVTDALIERCAVGDVSAIKYYLNNRDRDQWQDKIIREHTGNVGLTDMTQEELDKRIKELELQLERSTED